MANDPRDRHHIIDTNGEALDTTYGRALADGMRDPVVYVVDPRGRASRAMAIAHGETEANLDATLADFAARQSFPTLFLAMERDEAVRAESHPEFGHSTTATALSMMRDPAMYPVMCVAAGGVSLVFRPKSAGAAEAFEN